MHRYTVVSGQHDSRASGLGAQGFLETRVVEIEVLGDCVVGTCGGFRRVIRVFPVPRDGSPVRTEDACMWGTCIQESPCRD